MHEILAALYQALRLMPPSLALGDKADIVLTLLFWKLLSDSAANKLVWRTHPYFIPGAEAQQYMADNHIVVPPYCGYESCRWRQPHQAMGALRYALCRWVNAQANPLLETLLRPARFSQANRKMTIFKNSPVLAHVITRIGQLDFTRAAPGLSAGEIFSQARAFLRIEEDAAWLRANQLEAQLMVRLLQPLPYDTLFDPQFGNGQRLMACVEHVASHAPRHQLIIYGQETNASQYALTKMDLICQGLTCHHLKNDAPRHALLFGTKQLALRAVDVVLLRVPHEAQAWDYINATYEDFCRFPLPPPQDSRLALILHALACLKPETGRMAVVLPRRLLASCEGFSLRRHVVKNRHLAAVIELAGIVQQLEPPILLLLRAYHPSSRVAFISATLKQDPSGPPYGVNAIEQACVAARQNQGAPFLRKIDDVSMAKRGYAFNLAAYPLTQPACPGMPKNHTH